jgi:phosphoglycolate phosphatase-like HAD superfamily hydrolase
MDTRAVRNVMAKPRMPFAPQGNIEEIRAMLRDAKVLGVDKDGVVLNVSKLVYENVRRGFLTNAQPFDYAPKTLYLLRGVQGYNDGAAPIKAILAVNRMVGQGQSDGMPADQVMLGIVTGQNPAAELASVISRYVNWPVGMPDESITVALSDKPLIERIYWWDKGEFFNSRRAVDLMEPIAGAHSAFMELRERYQGRVAIVTNTHRKDTVMRDLKVAGFSAVELDSILVISNARKPTSYGIEVASHAFNVKMAQTAYVGDASIDIATARNSGSLSIGVLSGMGTFNVLAQEKPDLIVENLAQLASFLKD